MTAVPPESQVAEGLLSLEVRWIFPGQLEAAVARWFGRFPAVTETRQDAYLLNPPLPGLSVKIRGSRALEVKAYRGSPGILQVPGRARGRMESWQKWSFPCNPLSPDIPDIPRLEAGRQGTAHHLVLTGQRTDRGARHRAGPAAAVRGRTHHGPREQPALVDPGLRGDRPRRPAARGRSRPPPRSCSPTPCPKASNPAWTNRGPTRSG